MTLDASPPFGEYLYTVEQIEYKETYFLTQSLSTVQSSDILGIEPVLNWAEGKILAGRSSYKANKTAAPSLRTSGFAV